MHNDDPESRESALLRQNFTKFVRLFEHLYKFA